jgi:glycosyltransferase involved in cell wall biosynthesis
MEIKKKAVVAFATRWGTEFGGINSFNTDLLAALATVLTVELKVVCVVLTATDLDMENAARVDVLLLSLNLPLNVKEFTVELEPSVWSALEAVEITPSDFNVVWLGHDRITGAIALSSSNKRGGRSALIHHMSYTHYEPYVESSASAHKKRTEQRQLFENADIALAVGPLLRNALSDMLSIEQIPMLIPGLPNIAPRITPKTFIVFLSGRLNDSTKKIKQAYLGVAAFGDAIRQCSENTGFPDPLYRSNEPRLVLRGLEFEDVNGDIDADAEQDLRRFSERHAEGVMSMLALPFTTDRNELFYDLSSSSVAMMPSWHEGFGLVAWEAIAAGVPLILSRRSGAYQLLCEIDEAVLTSLVTEVDIRGLTEEPWFRDSDLENLAKALITIAKSPSEYRKKALRLRQELLKHYTWNDTAKQLLAALSWAECSELTSTEARSPSFSESPILSTFVPSSSALALVDIRAAFASTSAIGRSWLREIAGQTISIPVVSKILNAVDEGKRSILLTGLPGSGKTCVMLCVQDVLELRVQQGEELLPIFIQTSEFADRATALERKEQGLPESWVEQIAGAAEVTKIVVVIDSLDVLSIAREHSVLTYFLAQIDRLLLIENVTVVTACRDFDRHYDRRIAERKWDTEFTCPSLEWESEVVPLLGSLEIDIAIIDDSTRELITNPRELALFVELAKQEGSFNVVTSQALAQRYLTKIVEMDHLLGREAMLAIEEIADEMLRTRSLTVPHQRFLGSSDILRKLLSLRVLHQTKDEKLAFGHQTLLDVLVISKAVRSGITLSEFIGSLPPVPFVRPSIRSFVAQLALGDRTKFRMQLRTVLTGNSAFHVRRLVAESFAEQKPLDDDWTLINDLRLKHREVFQVIYMRATLAEWNDFWLTNLVPVLKIARDADGLAAHVHRISIWKNVDALRIMHFWNEVLNIEWINSERLVNTLANSLAEIEVEDTDTLLPLLEKLLELPQQEHSYLGHLAKRCVGPLGRGDALLWKFITSRISNEDLFAYRLGEKLHCQPYEFENGRAGNFLLQRILESTTLLDLTIGSIEEWSQAKRLRYGGEHHGYLTSFLRESSYNDQHSEHERHHVESERVLFDAMEAGILEQAKQNSEWWQKNRERLAFNSEGVLCYFALLGLTKVPETNLDLISRVVSNRSLLESELSFEVGALIKVSFALLDSETQDQLISIILSLYADKETDDHARAWVLFERTQLLLAVPRYMRSDESQELLDIFERRNFPQDRCPRINSRSGSVSAPFSHAVFLNIDDDRVMGLLAHYAGHSDWHGDDYLVGGEREVGSQLREAASRNPTRFLQLMSMRWSELSKVYCDEIMDGAATYLSYRHGNLQSNDSWVPLERPDALGLAQQILSELENHVYHWSRNRSASNAISSCANVVNNTLDASRLVFVAIGFENLREVEPIQGESVDLVTMGINMVRGHVVDALITMAIQLHDVDAAFPELLEPALSRLAADGHPAIRALVLRRLPFLQKKLPSLSWKLFDRAMSDPTGLWISAETCFYYGYQKNFKRIAALLSRLYTDGRGKELEVWGRISALSAMAGNLEFSSFLEDLKVLDSSEAWSGSSSVWTHSGNLVDHSEQCLLGIEAGLNARSAHASVVAGKTIRLFTDDDSVVGIPTALVVRCMKVIESDTPNRGHRFGGLEGWLGATAQRDPEQSLEILEYYLALVKRTNTFLHDYQNRITQLLTRLFAAAEEREEIDAGVMLARVVAVQDILLGLGVDGIEKWLKAAERP